MVEGLMWSGVQVQVVRLLVGSFCTSLDMHVRTLKWCPALPRNSASAP